MTAKTKEFDCVEMKREAALRIHATLEGKSREERLEYWHQRTVYFRERHPLIRDAETLQPRGA